MEENVIARTSAMAFGRGRIYTVRMQVRTPPSPSCCCVLRFLLLPPLSCAATGCRPAASLLPPLLG